MSTSILDLGEIESSLLVFGGPYSNLAATEALLEKAQQLGIAPSHILCTGDVVAYAAEPEQCSRLIKDAGIRLLMGNCELSLAEDMEDCGCGFEPGMRCSALSDAWFGYARRLVSPMIKAWMGSLPSAIEFYCQGLKFRAIHGGVQQINQFIFASSDALLKRQQLDAAGVDVIIGGHCGLPFGQRIEQGYWLNAGVIGLPANDGTQQGWYMLIQPVEQGVTISWHRLDYAVQQSYRSMRQAGLDDYAQSLLSGLWPSMDVLPSAERLVQGRALTVEDLTIPRLSTG